MLVVTREWGDKIWNVVSPLMLFLINVEQKILV